MSTTLPQQPAYDIYRIDRPGWIPEWVGDDWDPNPYAYQTEEELMPAGYEHNLYLSIILQMLTPYLTQRGLYIAADIFLFYRGFDERKQRIAPDSVIAPSVELTPAQRHKSYDLEVEPVPLCVIEVTSERSKARDLRGKRLLYAFLEIHEYLVIDILNDTNPDLLKLQFDLHLWRLHEDILAPVAPDNEGFLQLESIGVRIRADGQQLIVQVIETGEFLRTTTELRAELAVLEEARRRDSQARLLAEQARREAEERAVAEATERARAEERAAAEATERQRVEAELAQIRAELARLKSNDTSS